MQDNPSSTPQKKGEKKEEEKEKIEIGEEYVEERGLQRYLFAQLKGLEGLLGKNLYRDTFMYFQYFQTHINLFSRRGCGKL